jgi:FkbM family methyltransferase
LDSLANKRMPVELDENGNISAIDVGIIMYLIQNLPYLIKEDIFQGVREDGENLTFMANCLVNAKMSYSQNYQDIFVLFQTKSKENGYFVEFGATDGKTINNTFILEKMFGWQGILAEPNPYWHKNLQKNRSCHISKKCVYSETNQKIEFLNSESPDLSGISNFISESEKNKGEKTFVDTISLCDLLDEYSSPECIDYLSIDTEGSEYHILESYFKNNKKYDIQNITVEHNFDRENRNRIFDLLSRNGYKRKFAAFSRCDDFYVRES